MLALGSLITSDGFVTKWNNLAPASLAELEERIGYAKGRLARGAFLGKLLVLPTVTEFEIYGYSLTAAHREEQKRRKEGDAYWRGLDRMKLKHIALESFALSGPTMLVKLFPSIGHDSSVPDDLQYPRGSGIPQWKLIKFFRFEIIASCSSYPNGMLKVIAK